MGPGQLDSCCRLFWQSERLRLCTVFFGGDCVLTPMVDMIVSGSGRWLAKVQTLQNYYVAGSIYWVRSIVLGASGFRPCLAEAKGFDG